MDWKRLVREEVSRQEDSIAKAAVLEAFHAGFPARVTVGDVLEELAQDDRLNTAFECLTLEELRQTLGGTAAAKTTVYGPPGPDRRHGVTAQRILQYVSDHPGCSLGDVARTLGLKRGAVTSQMRSLRAEGRLRVEGKERRFRYYVA